MTTRVEPGDCLEVMARLIAEGVKVDSIVTDPPYHLTSIVKRFGKPGSAPAQEGTDGRFARASAGFMGKAWDGGDISFRSEVWSLAFQLLKPGGHLIAFGGTRTYHRIAVAIEDAGFEVRDMLSWLYGSGFPKSHDVAKGIDRARGEDLEPVRAICRIIRAAMDAKGLKSKDLIKNFGGCHARLIDHWAARDTDSQPSLPTWDQWLTLRDILAIDPSADLEVWRLNGRKGKPGDTWQNAEVVGEHDGQPGGFVDMRFSVKDRTMRAPSPIAVSWDGWGTALKPALEPACLARRPLDGTVAANVLAHGVGALNIDGCRIEGTEAKEYTVKRRKPGAEQNRTGGNFRADDAPEFRGKAKAGRWPANVIHDGGAARFFYTAKADKADRWGSKHPTVKPIDLIRYLARLVTPPGGLVLDPFAGSGTLGVACLAEGFNSILIEREAEYLADIRERIAFYEGGDRHSVSILNRAGKDETKGGGDLPLFRK